MEGRGRRPRALAIIWRRAEPGPHALETLETLGRTRDANMEAHHKRELQPFEGDESAYSPETHAARHDVAFPALCFAELGRFVPGARVSGAKTLARAGRRGALRARALRARAAGAELGAAGASFALAAAAVGRAAVLHTAGA